MPVTIKINQIPLEFMKTRFSQFFAIMLLAGLLMQGCQKEPQSVDSAGQADESVYTPKAAKLVADINSFKQKMTAVRENPHLKSGEVISKEEARWNIETLFNVTYGFPDLSYSKTITDTALVYLPVDASGNALLEDVVAVYEEVLALVTDFYLAANFDEKGFLFMQLKSGETINGQLEIKLETVTGARLGTQDDPPVGYDDVFDSNENWKYGDGLGQCEQIDNDESDAAEEIEIVIRSMNVGWPEPPSAYRWITINPFDIELEGNEFKDENDENLMFYLEKPIDIDFTDDEICLIYTEMNFHYYGEQQVIYELVPQTFDQFIDIEHWAFLDCNLKGQYKSKNETHLLQHKNILDYAERILVPIGDIPDAIELYQQN
jgi:hypothetical protein